MIVRDGLVLVGVLALAACSAASARPDARAPEPAARDVRLLLRDFDRIHPKPYPVAAKRRMRSAGARLIRRLPLESDRLLVELMRIVALSGEREGHSGIFPLDPSHRRRLHAFPIALYDFSDGIHVVAAAPPHRDLVGLKVIAIGGVPVERALAAVRPMIARDNVHQIRLLAPHFLVVPEILHGAGLLPTAGPAAFTVAAGEGSTREVLLRPLTAAAYTAALADDFLHYPVGLPQRPEPLALRRVREQAYTALLDGGRVLYVGFNSVQGVPPEVTDEIDRAGRDPRVRRIVVDVRYNGGGNNMSYGPLVFSLRQAVVDRPGKLVVLIGRSTFSAAKDFVCDLERAARNEIFVGEPIGGAPNQWGDSTSFRLPVTGWNVHVPTVWVQRGRGPRDPRLTLVPRVRVDASSRDFLAGRDPVLDAALALP